MEERALMAWWMLGRMTRLKTELEDGCCAGSNGRGPVSGVSEPFGGVWISKSLLMWVTLMDLEGMVLMGSYDGSVMTMEFKGDEAA